MLKILFKTTTLFFITLLLTAGSAMALSISFDNGNDDIIELTVNDDDNDGYVYYNGLLNNGTNIGQWDINSLAGVSHPALGTDTLPMLDLFSLTLDYYPLNGLGGVLAVSVEDTYADFNDLDSTINGFVASIGGTTCGTVDFSASINGYALDILWDDMTHNYTAFSAAESIALADIPTGSPFTLSMKAVITQGAGITTFDANIAPVPEPATILLFGTGLIGIAGITRRKLGLGKDRR